MSKRNQILQEIILTEKVYLTNMQTLLTVYGRPLQKNSALLSPKEYHIIFTDINVIVNVAAGLLQALEQLYEEEHSAKRPTLTLGQIFMKFGPMFKSYTNYCNKFDQIMQILRQRKAECEEFKDFLAEQKKEANGTSIDSFLINPVQRIPRYNLLLREMLQNTSTMHRDYETLQQALQTMKATADFVNSRMEEFERRQRLTELASTIQGLPFELIAPHRSWHCEGDMHVLLLKDLVRIDSLDIESMPLKRVFLFNDMIICCSLITVNDENSGSGGVGGGKKRGKEKKSAESTLTVRYDCHLQLDDDAFPWIADLEDKDKLTNAFQIVTATDNFTFLLTSAESKQEWIENVADLLDKIASSRPELRKNRAKYKKHLQIEDMLDGTDVLDQDKAKQRMSPLALIKKKKKKKKSKSGFSDDDDTRSTLLPIGSILFPGNMPKRSDIPCLTTNELELFKTMSNNHVISIVRAMYTYDPQQNAAEVKNDSLQQGAKSKQHKYRTKGEPDELSFVKGDILFVIQKNVGKNEKWWVARKVGLSVDPDVRKERHMADDYNVLKEIQKQKMKQMGGSMSPVESRQRAKNSPGRFARTQSHIINISYINGIDDRELSFTLDDDKSTSNKEENAAETISVAGAAMSMSHLVQKAGSDVRRKKSKSVFSRRKSAPNINDSNDSSSTDLETEMKKKQIEQEEQLLSKMINIFEESGEVGIIAHRYFVEFSPDLHDKLFRIVDDRNEMEERKLRNFKIKKRAGPSSLQKYVQKERENVNEFHLEIERRKSRASTSTAAAARIIQKDMQSMRLDEDGTVIKSPRFKSPRSEGSLTPSTPSASIGTTSPQPISKSASLHLPNSANSSSSSDMLTSDASHYRIQDSATSKPASRRKSLFHFIKSKK